MVTFIGDAGLLFLKRSCWRCWGTDALHAGKHIRIEAAVSQSENGWTLCIQMFFVVSSLPMQQGAVVFQPLWAQVLIYSTSPPLPLTAQPEPSVSHGEAPLPSRQAKRSFCAQLAEKKKTTLPYRAELKPYKYKEQVCHRQLVESAHTGRRRAGITKSEMILVLT